MPYWVPMITKHESQLIERILKTALHIILQEQYLTFHQALKLTRMKSLPLRRKEIFYKFCKKNRELWFFQEMVFWAWKNQADKEDPTKIQTSQLSHHPLWKEYNSNDDKNFIMASPQNLHTSHYVLTVLFCYRFRLLLLLLWCKGWLLWGR